MSALLFAAVVLPVALAEVPTKRPKDRELAAQLYRQNCVACHGKRALGDGPLAEATGASALAGRVPDGAEEAWVETISTGAGSMPGYSSVFHRKDARRVVDWLEGLNPETGRGAGLAKIDEEEETDEEEGAAGEGAGEGEGTEDDEEADSKPQAEAEPSDDADNSDDSDEPQDEEEAQEDGKPPLVRPKERLPTRLDTEGEQAAPGADEAPAADEAPEQ